MHRPAVKDSIWVVAALAAAFSLAGTMSAAPQKQRASDPGGAVIALSPGGSFLGVHVREIDPELAKTKKLPEVRGVEVTRVVDGSAAQEGGLRVGDIVLAYGDHRVEGVTQFARLVRETPPGRRVRLSLVRDGQSKQVEVTIGRRRAVLLRPPAEPRWALPGALSPGLMIPDVPHVFTTWRVAQLGIVGEALESQLAAYFGVRKGVLVRSVSESGPAAQAGLRAGDVIVGVGDKAVATPREASSAIRKLKADSILLHVFRDRKELSIRISPECCREGDGAGRQREHRGREAIKM